MPAGKAVFFRAEGYGKIKICGCVILPEYRVNFAP